MSHCKLPLLQAKHTQVISIPVRWCGFQSQHYPGPTPSVCCGSSKSFINCCPWYQIQTPEGHHKVEENHELLPWSSGVMEMAGALEIGRCGGNLSADPTSSLSLLSKEVNLAIFPWSGHFYLPFPFTGNPFLLFVFTYYFVLCFYPFHF